MDELVFPIVGAESRLPVYTVGIGWHSNQYPIERKTGFPYFQIFYCTKGKGILHINENEYHISSGQGFLLYPDEAHEYHAVTEPWELHWVDFDGRELFSLVRSLGYTESTIFYILDMTSINDVWSQLLSETQSSHSSSGFRCSALIYSLLILLKSIASPEPSVGENKKQQQLHQITSFIDNNYSQDFSIEELSSCIQVSSQYLCRLFQQQMNMRPFEYVSKKRIKEAKQLLADTSLSIAQIADTCGFHSFSYFCQVFKRLEFVTPAEFRKLHGS